MASKSSSENAADLEEDCLNIANRLVRLCHLPYPRITSLRDMQSNFFIQVFERICHAPVPDLKSVPVSIEEEAHNVQTVIDTLSLDILSISLSHITGEDIVAGNVRAIKNLLEVLEGYLLYLQEDVCPPKPDEVKDSVSSQTERRAHSVCYICGYDSSSKVTERHQKEEMLSSKFMCPVCHYLLGSQINDSNVPSTAFEYHSGAKEPVGSHRVDSEELQGGVLQTLSEKSEEKSSSDDNFTTPVPLPTFVENGKLRPEFVRVGLRDHPKTDQGAHAAAKEDKQHKLASTSKPSDGNRHLAEEVPRPSTELLHSSPPSLSPPINTVIFKAPNGKVPASEQDGHPQDHRAEKFQRLPYSMQGSRSQEDILQRDAMPVKRDRMTQTSHGVLNEEDKEIHLEKAKRPKTKKKPEIEQVFTVHDQEDVAEMYGKNMVKRITAFLEKSQHSRHVSEIKRAYMQSLKRPHRKSISPICRKSFLLPYYLRRRSISHTTPKKVHTRTASKLSQHSSKSKGVQEQPSAREKTLIKELITEFPGVNVSPATVRHMSKKYEKHLVAMHRKLKDSLLQKSQTQIQNEQAIKRQKILSEIFNKEMQHNRYLNEFNEHKSLERKLDAAHRDARIESARMKQYHDEFHEQMKRRLQKRNYSEEQLLKNVFDDGLQMQKEQVNQLRQQLREREGKDGKQHQIYLESLENFYQTQFSLLAKSLAIEKHDMEVRAKAQQRALNTMKRDFRSRMEREVRSMQEQIVSNTEDIHFREMDAERLRENLQDRFSAHPLHQI